MTCHARLTLSDDHDAPAPHTLRRVAIAPRRAEAHDENQLRAGGATWRGVGTGRPVLAPAGLVEPGVEHRRERAKALGEDGRVHGTVTGLRIVGQAGRVERRRLDGEADHHDLGMAQQDENEPADGQRPGGGALGQHGERDEQRDDAPNRPLLPCCIHARIPFTTGGHCGVMCGGCG